MYDSGHSFFSQECDLLEAYARYAASALDSATALMQASALLELARALATAGTSGEVAHQLADAVPLVVDCDRVGVYLWDAVRGEIVRQASNHRDAASAVGEDLEWSRAPVPGGPLQRLLNAPQSEPMFVDADEGDPVLRDLFTSVGAVASILVPIATRENLLGLLAVSVTGPPERLRPNPVLLDRLSGVAAQATTALQNGRLLDQITYQALHDELTGLANRAQFNDDLRSAVHRASRSSEIVTLFYIDLDGFKPVNDKLGHDLGDQLLISVAGRLTRLTRSRDTVARLGGDEFAVLLVGHSAREDADAVDSHLQGAFDSPFVIDGHALHVGASVGRAAFPTDAKDAEGLLRAADAAMFETKRRHHQLTPELARGR